MFDRQYRLYSRILLAADALAVIPAVFLAYWSRVYLVRFAPEELDRFFHAELLPFSDYLWYLAIFLPAWFFLLIGTQRYEAVLRHPLRWQFTRLFNFFLVAGTLMGFITFSLKLEISRPIFFTFFAVTLVLLPLNRVILNWVLWSRNLNKHNQIRILIVGTDQEARRVGEIITAGRDWGYKVIGHVRMNGPSEGEEGLNILGGIEQLPVLLQDEGLADEVIFSGAPKNEVGCYEDVLRLCEDLGVRIRVAADLIPIPASQATLEFLDTLPLITFSSAPDHSISIVLKRIIDFLVATTTLIMLSPLMLLTAVAIKVTSAGPVFYRQARCGLYGRKFRLTKFRTMINGADDKLWEIRHLNEMDGPVFKMRNDPRVTPLGRILRKTSIDELPQLWNVIRGEMSIVGPRAPLPEEVEHYSIRQRRRLSVKPGITCLWQVSGRSNISFERWMAMDLEYIDRWSIWLDLLIMLKTIPAVFTGRGAH
ncbi:MAG: sugar transferase [Acidobacteriota bacterium]|nr:MAG: sugar transferase [Acidobacteriota bacterium]